VKAVIDEMVRLKAQLRAERSKLAEAAHAKGLDSRRWSGHSFSKGWCGHGEGPCDGPGFGRDRGPKGHGMMGSGRHHGGPMMNDND
jgi:hypothetical protein